MIQDGNEGKKKQKIDEPEKNKKKGKKFKLLKPNKLWYRPHPRLFTDAINQMSDAQKEWVSQAGFGNLLSFSMKKIPNYLAVNAVWWFDYDNCWLNLSEDRILNITEKDIHDILGLPMGDMDITLVSNEAILGEWRTQFRKKLAGHKITEKMVFRAITQSTEVDLQFKQNFMVLMSNLFVQCMKNSYVSQEVLGFIGDFDDAANYNWCKLVIQGLKRGSKQWLEDPENQRYTGSLMFLIVR